MSNRLLVARARRLLFSTALAICSICLILAFSAWQSGLIAPWRPSRIISSQAVAQGRDFLKKGKPRRAIQAVLQIEPGDPEEPEAWAIRGMAHAALEDVASCRTDLERAWRLRRDPMTAKVLAAVYLAANESDRGLALLEAAAQIDPADFRPWYAMGDSVFRQLGRNEEAVLAFGEALRRRPSHIESRVGLIDVLLKLQKTEQAQPLLEGLRRERPLDPEVLVLAARLALAMGKQDEALRDLDQSLSLQPDLRQALALRAQSHFRARRTDKALIDVERALALDPNDLAALNLLASIQTSLGKSDQATATVARRHKVEERATRIAELCKNIHAKPDDSALRCRLAELAVESGLIPLAKQSYQAALALDPECDSARRGLLALGAASSQGSTALFPQ
jgi:tetratricopeptide (TPR) repeat protein